MNKKFYFLASTSLIIGLMFTSCVSSRKFAASEMKVNKLENDSTRTHKQLGECNAQLTNLKEENAALVTENAFFHTELTDLTEASKMTIADQAKQLKNFKLTVQAQKELMSTVKKSIEDALLNYRFNWV